MKIGIELRAREHPPRTVVVSMVRSSRMSNLSNIGPGRVWKVVSLTQPMDDPPTDADDAGVRENPVRLLWSIFADETHSQHTARFQSSRGRGTV